MRLIRIKIFVAFSCIITCLRSQDISTLAGNGNSGFCGDAGPATLACIDNPKGVFVDKKGNVYVADRFNNRIRKIDPLGIINTIAGTGSAGYNGDGLSAINAKLNFASGVTADKKGNIYIADENNFRIRKIDTSGIITTVAGTGTSGYNGDSIAASIAQIGLVVELTTDTLDNIYFVDYGCFRIRKINVLSGLISSIAGNGSSGYSGDGGPAINAQISGGDGLKFDRHGNLFYADFYNNRVRMIDVNGIISTVAGDGGSGYGGDGGSATQAQLYQPVGLAIDHLDNIYIAGGFSNNVRRFRVNGNIDVVAGTGTSGFSGDGGPALLASMGAVLDVAVDTAGALYINDAGNNRVRKVDNSVGINYITDDLELKLFPNPASDKIFINSDRDVYITILDLLGHEIISTSNKEIDVRGLNSGIYLVRLRLNSGSAFAKIAVEH